MVVGCALLSAAALGQSERPQPGTIADAIREVKGGNYAYVREITRLAGSEKAIPILEDLFAHAENADTKPWIASELVKLGDKDNTYWQFVAKLATEELEDGPPDFLKFDQDGKGSAGPSPEFLAWAKAHDLAPQALTYEAVMPIKFGMLVATRDPRAIPLLRRGLLAPNHLLEAIAALGLVELKDRDSIPLIVEACKRAPKDAAGAIAMSLLRFHDAEAQAAAEPYLPEVLVKKLHEEKQ